MERKRRWFPWQPKKRDDQEIEELREKIRDRSDDPKLHQRLAQLLLERGRRAEAMDAFVKAAQCHAEAGFHVRAIAMYRRVLRMEETPEVMVKLAELYLANGYMGDALAQYKKVIKHYRGQGKPHEILNVLRRMVEVDPERLEIRLKYVELLRSEGFLAEALDELARLYAQQRETGESATLRDLRDEIHSLAKELEEQLSSQGRGHELETLRHRIPELGSEMREMSVPLSAVREGSHEPSRADREEELDILEIQEEPEQLEAQQPGDRPSGYEESAPEDLAARLEEAMVYEEHALWEEAEQIYNLILESDPSCKEAAEGLKRIEKARATLAAHQVPSDIKRLDQLERQQRELSQKSPTEDKALKDFRAHYELGLAYRELGLMDEAISELRRASSEPSLAFACYRELGLCYRSSGDLGEAVSWLRKALQCKGVSRREMLEVGYELARTLEAQGRSREALSLYKKIQESDRSFRDIQERVKALSG